MKKIIAGVDEVGRGSLVGPVYAAAVILKKEINAKLLKDSKLLSKQDREKLNIYIKKKFLLVNWQSISKRNRRPKYLKCKLISYEKSYKKT